MGPYLHLESNAIRLFHFHVSFIAFSGLQSLSPSSPQHPIYTISGFALYKFNV